MQYDHLSTLVWVDVQNICQLYDVHCIYYRHVIVIIQLLLLMFYLYRKYDFTIILYKLGIVRRAGHLKLLIDIQSIRLIEI